MSLIIALLLGFVQGIAEFLPISSSGHLILLSKILGIQNDIFAISILLHFATLFVVIFTFRKYIWKMIRNPLSKDSINLYIAIIPTFLLVLFYKSYLEDFFTMSKLLPFGFLTTGILILLTYFLTNNKFKKNYKEDYLSIKKSSAVLMGISQGFAVLPGISRLGITMSTGILAGESKEKTIRFSFILSIPIIIGSLIYELIKNGTHFVANQNAMPLILAFAVTFFVGLISIKFMLNIVKKGKYYWFSVYLFLISILSLFVI